MPLGGSVPDNEAFWLHGETEWRFFRAREGQRPIDFRSSEFLICVSLKNPRFSNAWLTEALAGSSDLGRQTVVTLVDSPYFETLGPVDMTLMERQRRLGRLARQRDEQLARIQRLTDDFGRSCVFRPWSSFQDQTAQPLKEELYAAFGGGGRVTRLISEQVRSVMDMLLDDPEVQHFARFLLEEIPVLVTIYYRVMNGCVDVYPGEQAPFFWALDRGELADELPLMTAMAIAGAPHTYAAFYL
jgi:hypothetical protein